MVGRQGDSGVSIDLKMSVAAGHSVESGSFDSVSKGGRPATQGREYRRAGETSNYLLALGYALAGISEKNIGSLSCFSLKLLITKS